MRLLDDDLDAEVRRQLPLLTIGRLVGNGVFRLAAPFLGAIGRGLGVPITTMGEAVSAGDFTGLLAPAIGRRLDQGRHARAMTLGMAVIAIGAAVAAASPSALVIGVAFVLVSFGKLLYDPAVNTWASERVPYERRARAIGFIELSWASSMLLVVPIAGVVVAVAGWRWAYGLLATIAAAMTVAVHRRVRDGGAGPVELLDRVRFRFSGPIVAGLVGFALLMTAANAGFVVFGAWAGDAFGYPPAVIGLAGVLLGLMELAATVATMRITDRIGKRTAVMAGAALMVPAGLLLGLAGHRAWLGLALFALYVLGFEFAIVSGLPLVAELQTDARAASLGFAIGLGTVGRGVMSIVTTRLYAAHGMGASGALGAACALGVVAVYGLGLRRTGLR